MSSMPTYSGTPSRDTTMLIVLIAIPFLSNNATHFRDVSARITRAVTSNIYPIDMTGSPEKKS